MIYTKIVDSQTYKRHVTIYWGDALQLIEESEILAANKADYCRI